MTCVGNRPVSTRKRAGATTRLAAGPTPSLPGAASRLVGQPCSSSQAEQTPISEMRRILNILAPALLCDDWSTSAFSPVPTPAPTVLCLASETQLSLVLKDHSGNGWEGATATLSTDPFANVTHSITLASGTDRTWETCVQSGYYYLSISNGSSPADLGWSVCGQSGNGSLVLARIFAHDDACEFTNMDPTPLPSPAPIPIPTIAVCTTASSYQVEGCEDTGGK